MESWQPLAAYLADMCSKPVGKVDIFVWECLPQCMCLWERAPSTMFFFHQPSAPSFGCATGFENPHEISEAFWWLNCDFWIWWGFRRAIIYYIYTRMERTKMVNIPSGNQAWLAGTFYIWFERFTAKKKHVGFYGWWGPPSDVCSLLNYI